MNYNHAAELVARAESLTQLYAALRVENAGDVFSEYCCNEFMRKKAWLAGAPMYGHFELTPLCNLDCKMCYVHLSPGQLKDKKPLTADQWLAIASQAIEEGMLQCTLSGGECLAYPGFDDIYRFMLSRGVRTCVYTNALLLDEKRVEFFNRYRPEEIQVTIYGHNDDVYERVTGHRVFRKVTDNVLRARDAGLPVRIAVTQNKYLGRDDEALIRFLEEKKLDYTLNMGLFTPHEETGRAGEDHDETVADYIRLKCLKRELSGENPPEPCMVALPENAHTGNGDAPVGLRCGGGHCAFNIDWQGRMYACSMLDIPYAEPLETGFAKAWEIVKQTASEYPLPVECEGCAYQEVSQHCPALHGVEAPKGHASPRMCEYCREIVRSGLEKLDV